jgi:hypothetical protein
MSTKEDSPILRAQWSYEKLAASAKTLNTISDQMGETVSELDATFKRLNLGIASWISFNSWSEGPDWACDEIGYAKVNGKWGLAIRSRNGNYQYDDENVTAEWIFNEAPRALRLEAVDRIPDLLEELVENVGKFTHNLTEKLKKSRELSAALGAVANAVEQHPGKANEVPRAPTLDWVRATLKIPPEAPPISDEPTGAIHNSSLPSAPPPIVGSTPIATRISGVPSAPPPIVGSTPIATRISGVPSAPPPIIGGTSTGARISGVPSAPPPIIGGTSTATHISGVPSSPPPASGNMASSPNLAPTPNALPDLGRTKLHPRKFRVEQRVK